MGTSTVGVGRHAEWHGGWRMGGDVQTECSCQGLRASWNFKGVSGGAGQEDCNVGVGWLHRHRRLTAADGHVVLLCPVTVQAAVLSAAKVIVESCRNLLSYFEDLAAANGLSLSGSSSAATGDADMLPAADAAGASSGSNSDSDESVAAKFKAVLVKHVQDEGVIEWLVPPMLQGSNVDVDGWV